MIKYYLNYKYTFKTPLQLNLIVEQCIIRITICASTTPALAPVQAQFLRAPLHRLQSHAQLTVRLQPQAGQPLAVGPDARVLQLGPLIGPPAQQRGPHVRAARIQNGRPEQRRSGAQRRMQTTVALHRFASPPVAAVQADDDLGPCERHQWRRDTISIIDLILIVRTHTYIHADWSPGT